MKTILIMIVFSSISFAQEITHKLDLKTAQTIIKKNCDKTMTLARNESILASNNKHGVKRYSHDYNCNDLVVKLRATAFEKEKGLNISFYDKVNNVYLPKLSVNHQVDISLLLLKTYQLSDESKKMDTFIASLPEKRKKELEEYQAEKKVYDSKVKNSIERLSK